MIKGRYYLNDLNIEEYDIPQNWNPKDSRQRQWRKERKKYGFDERETWALNYTYAIWLYERLMSFKEITTEIIDLDYHVFQYGEKDYTQGEAIDFILENLKLYIEDDDNNNALQEATEMWAIIVPVMWW